MHTQVHTCIEAQIGAKIKAHTLAQPLLAVAQLVDSFLQEHSVMRVVRALADWHGENMVYISENDNIERIIAQACMRENFRYRQDSRRN
jgi:hypothetical protein